MIDWEANEWLHRARANTRIEKEQTHVVDVAHRVIVTTPLTSSRLGFVRFFYYLLFVYANRCVCVLCAYLLIENILNDGHEHNGVHLNRTMIHSRRWNRLFAWYFVHISMRICCMERLTKYSQRSWRGNTQYTIRTRCSCYSVPCATKKKKMRENQWSIYS